MGYLAWFLGIAVCALLHQAFEGSKLRAENEKLRKAIASLEANAGNLKGVANGSLLATAYAVSQNGGRLEIPRWAQECDWELQQRRDPATGALVLTAEEVIVQ